MPKSKPRSPWRREWRHLIHALAGAFLFGMPFLYTMEVWWRGNTAGPPRMLAALGLTYVALVLLERGAASRAGRDASLPRASAEGAQALATGLVAAAAGLFLIGFLTPESGLHALVGRVVMEGLPFALGVGLADFLLGEKDGEDGKKAEGDGQGSRPQSPEDVRRRVVVRAGGTALGAIVVALTLAPTEEIPLISNGLRYPHLLGLAAASLVISYMIVFASNFVATEARREHGGGFDAPLVETALSYLISLVMAAGMLWLYQLLDPTEPPARWVGYVLVLGLPASVGGAAGRLAL